MATISVTEEEYQAIRMLVDEATSKLESASYQPYIDSMNEASDHFASFEKKYKTARNKEANRRLVANALKRKVAHCRIGS